MYQAELNGRSRQQGESLPALGQAIRKLVTCAFPELNANAVEMFSIRYFIDALTDDKQRQIVHESRPTNLDDAVQLAMTRESWQISEKKRKRENGEMVEVCRVNDRNPPRFDEEILRKILERLESLEKKEEEREKKREMVCFKCQHKGHMARFCRNSPTGAQENSSQPR